MPKYRHILDRPFLLLEVIMTEQKTKKPLPTPVLEPRVVSTAIAARYLGMAHQTFYNRTNPKSKSPLPIPKVRIGRRVLYDIADLDAFIDDIKE